MRGLVAFAVAMSAALAAQAPPSRQSIPRFRSGVELVTVDVSVTDRDGQPVRDLTVEDFAVEVSGSPRRLTSATFIPLGEDARPPLATTDIEAAPAEAGARFSTNEGAVGGRLILFVVDRGNIRAGDGKRLFREAAGFLDRLGPADRVALAVVPGGGPHVEFTADRSLVKAGLERATGGATPPLTLSYIGLSEALAIHRENIGVRETVFRRECKASSNPRDPIRTDCQNVILSEARLVYFTWRQQTSATVAAIRDLLARLSLIGGPKTMVVLTEGWFVDPWEATELTALADAAARADVTLYTLGLDSDRSDAATAQVSPTAHDDRILLRQGLEMAAGMAGGRNFSVPAGAAAAFARLARELSGYYLLSFEPAPRDADGRAHRIDVDVRRGGVEVRTRRHFVAADSPASRPVSDVLAEILRSPRPSTDLRMRVATFAYPGDAGLLRVVIAAEIDGATSSAPLPCGFSLTNAAGETVGAEIEGISAAADPKGDRHAYLASFALAPGPYTLRLAAVDPEGRRGSVEHALDARLPVAEGLRVGDLMLADGEPGAAAPRPSIDARIRGGRVLAYLEFASDDASLLDAAGVELTLSASESGETVATSQARIRSRSATIRTAEGHFDTTGLAPGDYKLRAVVSADGRALGTVTRVLQVRGGPD